MSPVKNDKSLKIFVDLDGTLLDISEKYYQVYAEFMRVSRLRILKKNTFWSLKRKKRNDPLIENDISLKKRFNIFFLKNIEKNLYLKHDFLFNDVILTLKKLNQSGYLLLLITLRRNKKNMQKQIRKLKLNFYFSKIICGKPNLYDSSKNYLNKINLIKKYINRNSVIVGDSAADILCGKKLGLKIAAVLSGISNYSRIKSFKPDHIIRDFNSLEKIL